MGAALTFWLYRWGFKKIENKYNTHWKWIEKLNAANPKKHGFLVLLARITPFIPSGIVTFAAAVSNMELGIFLAVTLIGKIPSIALETLIGHDLIYLKDNYFRLIISVLILVVMCLILKSKKG